MPISKGVAIASRSDYRWLRRLRNRWRCPRVTWSHCVSCDTPGCSIVLVGIGPNNVVVYLEARLNKVSEHIGVNGPTKVLASQCPARKVGWDSSAATLQMLMAELLLGFGAVRRSASSRLCLTPTKIASAPRSTFCFIAFGVLWSTHSMCHGGMPIGHRSR